MPYVEVPPSSSGGGSSSVTASALTNSSGALTMGNTAAIIVPYSASRKSVVIYNNTSGSETQWIGSSNVTVSGGIPLQPGGGYLFSGVGASGPIYGVTTVSSSPYSYVEG